MSDPITALILIPHDPARALLPVLAASLDGTLIALSVDADTLPHALALALLEVRGE